MKQTSLKRILAALLAASCVLSMTACAKSGQQTASSGSQAQQVEETNPGPFGKYKQTVTLTRAQMTTTATQWQNGDTATSNPWTRAAKDEFNIDLQDAWSADGSQYNNKINLGIASQTLPDVFWVDSNQLAQVVQSGMVADMTQAYEKYASKETKALMDADTETFDSGKYDGKLYGISTQHFGVISQMQCVWIRQDWMKKLNLQAPKSMDDLINICQKFVSNDPDGNGKADTYGLAVDKSLGSLYGLMTAYHANPGIWLNTSDSKITYGSIQPEVKNALSAFQSMYQKGIISKEFGVKDSDKVTEDLVSGKVGVAVWGSSFGYAPGIDIIKKNGADAIFKPYAIPSSDGQQVKMTIDWPVGNYLVVNKNCKNPEAAIKMINLHTRVNQDAKVYDEFLNNERSWGAIPFQVQNPMADYNQYVAISAAQDTRDTSKLKPDQVTKYEKVIDWIDNKNPDSVGQYLQVSKDGAYGIMKPFVDNQWYVRTAFHGVSTKTMTAKLSSLKTMEAETFTKIIMGQDVNSFDNMVTQWKNLGGEKICEELKASERK